MPEPTPSQVDTTDEQPQAGTQTEEEKSPADEPKTVSIEAHRKAQNEAKNLRERLKEAEAVIAQRKKEDDDKQLAEMSEIDRLKKLLADSEAKAKTLEIQAIRSRAATKHGLPEDLLPFLTAEDEAGATAQAQLLASKLAKPETKADLPPAGGRAPVNGEKPKTISPEEQRLADRLVANSW